ncbi:MAG: DUF1501 domain-containing protein [Fuerstiella sp.]|nr:DUF1501 domain-containing protein [Fuerstiella sp.]
MQTETRKVQHPVFSRRSTIQAGALGFPGLGMNHVRQLQAASPAESAPAKRVVYVFLTGGLSQHDSFDMKPLAPDNVRGEFQPISTKIPGLHICEHLPLLAQRAHKWALVRSLSHSSNEHNESHTIMLTGRSQLPPGYDRNKPQPGDWPSIAAIAGRLTEQRGNLPPAVVLPQRLLNMNQGGVVIPGQFAGTMGSRHDPWFIEASPYRGNDVKGAYPDYAFRRRSENRVVDRSQFKAPGLSLPEGLTTARMDRRTELLASIEAQRRELDNSAAANKFDRFRQGAVSLLTDSRVQQAFDVTSAKPEIAERYGRNLFGWSMLMARRLLDTGVNLIQVNLGNFNTWDLHGAIFPLLRDMLFPPADRALTAFLDDLDESGLLTETLVVVAGEFGRTPKIFRLPNTYKLPGRDHWGGVQTVLLAGAGITGGTVIGSSDKLGAYPASEPQRPENLAATIYQALGLPRSAVWYDDLDRPHGIYHGTPIPGLL